MRLENIVWDAADPHRLGSFWAAALGATVMTDERQGLEARLTFGDDAFLDLCFQPVADGSDVPPRLHLDLYGGADHAALVQRLIGLGAAPADIGQGAVPWVVLADPEGNAFCVMHHRDAHSGTGPIAALPLDSADPQRDAAFWAAITGWVPVAGIAPATLRHPSGRGPLLELCDEPEPARGKNRIHLDVRGDRCDGDLGARAVDLGATPVTEAWALDQPWRVYTDPSGNAFCIL